jgi:two-component system LytT family response regulator
VPSQQRATPSDSFDSGGAAATLDSALHAYFDAQLDPGRFTRIHRRYIVNLDRIVEIQPWFAGDAVVALRSGAKLRLSRTHRAGLHLLGSSVVGE